MLGFCAPVAAPAAPLKDTDWPQWRGPARDGQAAGVAWGDSLQTNHLRQLWSVPLAPGYSGALVIGDRVFTTETKAKQTEIVRALDRATGKELWQANWEGAISVPFFAKSSGDWIRATPACDGDSLFVAGMRDVLVCLDCATGKEKWRVDFVKELKAPVPDFGFVSSPLLDGEFLFVQAGASVVKLKKSTGEIVWRGLPDGGGMMGSAFSSPILASLAGQRQLIVQTREKLAGLDPASGKVLWTQPVEAFRGMNILTPVVFGESVFTSTYGGKTIAFKVTREGDAFTVAPAWTHKAQGNLTTPVVVGPYAYLQLRNQRALCLDLRTGEEKWMTEKGFGKYWSLVANGDRILALDERGLLFLLRANPEKFDVVDQRKLSDADSWAHLAVSGRDLYVRELNALVAYRFE